MASCSPDSHSEAEAVAGRPHTPRSRRKGNDRILLSQAKAFGEPSLECSRRPRRGLLEPRLLHMDGLERVVHVAEAHLAVLGDRREAPRLLGGGYLRAS